MADRQNQLGDRDAALRSLENAEDMASRLTQEDDRLQAHFLVAKAYLRLNKNERAQKVLLAIKSSAEMSFNRMDTLFDLQIKSADESAAKSTFVSLQKSLIPWPKDYDPDVNSDYKSEKNQAKKSQYDNARTQRYQLSNSLLQAGWLEQWKELYKTDLKDHKLVLDGNYRALAKLATADYAIRIVEESSTSQQEYVSGLWALALFVPDKS